jgi:hypothetical protein
MQFLIVVSGKEGCGRSGRCAGRRISTGINACIFPVETGGAGGAIEAGCEAALAVRACVTHLEHTTGSVI